MAAHVISVRRVKVRPAECPGFRPVMIADRFMAAAELRRSGVDAPLGVIDFLVDTGADRTSISVDDAQLLGLYGMSLSVGCPSSTRGIGGEIPLRYLPSLSLIFHGPEGQEPAIWHTKALAVLYLDEAKRQDQALRGCPSLLGRDFLARCRFEINRADPLLYFE